MSRWRRAAAGNDTAGPVRWHMIGNLQAQQGSPDPPPGRLDPFDGYAPPGRGEISARAEKDNPAVAEVLVQANVSGEKSKAASSAAVPYLVEQVASLPSFKIAGLMTMAPLVDNPQEVRGVFARTRGARSRRWPAGRRPRRPISRWA